MDCLYPRDQPQPVREKKSLALHTKGIVSIRKTTPAGPVVAKVASASDSPFDFKLALLCDW